MNSKPIFHIFGVPDGFDILNGTPDITPYFQRYYNGSEENTKYSIHRDSNGNITYAYLKYNLSSYQSRTGSFFGMSLTFSNEYCTDPMKLYRLFDFVYADKVLGSNAEKGLLQKIEVESKIQARYLIPNFGSAKEYIQQEIEFVLLNNITKLFANSFQPISVRFKNDQSHLVAQIPFADANNKKIISLLHTYNRIAISPDWEPDPTVIPGGSTTPPEPKIRIAPETIQLCEENVKKYQSYLIEGFANVKAVNIGKARQGKAEIESVLKKLQSGTSTDQRLPQLISDYKALSGRFAELIQKIADEQNSRPTTPPRNPSPSTKHPIPKHPIPWWKRYLPYIFGFAVLVIFVIFVVVLSNNKKEEPKNPVDTSNVSSPPVENDILPLVRKAIHEKRYHYALVELKKLEHYTQYDLYDSIFDPWIADLLHDNEWNDAWQAAEDIEKKKPKDEKQSEIRNKCEEYFTDKVSKVKKADAQGILDEINGLMFNYNKRNEHINTLQGILNPPQNTNAGGTGGRNEQTKSFCIRIQQWNSSDDPCDMYKTIPIHNDTTISTNCKFIYFCLTANDSYAVITDSSYKIEGDCENAVQGDHWYKVDLTKSKNKKVAVKHKSESITITFK